jgi:hypothetical protein
MTKRWPCILTLLLCCLFAFASPVRAACAWVLWGQSVDPWNALVALPLGAWASRDQCEEERRKREQAPEELRMAAYTCLPDTIDPRGPRGQ